MALMETMVEEEQAVELFGSPEDILKGMGISLWRGVQEAIDLNVAVVVPAIAIETTMVVGVVADTFVTFPPITSGAT